MKGFRARLTIERPFMPAPGVRPRDAFEWGHDGVCWSMLVPVPFQAGDTPSQMFAERHGVRDQLLQYGQAMVTR